MTIEESLRNRILFIGKEIPKALMVDPRPKFIILGYPQEVIDETNIESQEQADKGGFLIDDRPGKIKNPLQMKKMLEKKGYKVSLASEKQVEGWEEEYNLLFNDCEVVHVYETKQFMEIKEFIRKQLERQKRELREKLENMKQWDFDGIHPENNELIDNVHNRLIQQVLALLEKTK